ncbi:MraY family glycosyltransferase [Azohydromonas caseinilytica]|uniref:Glycosyl transferase n=1 Tax=Azohydromonas caseinilytica TaxID=2728836 RepID=A0A848F9C9_9BURK|nr:glycosyltransferase [Azohydromonas caseinilytica]NML15069.1 glycosyl transferase [Azohydromonas caseinilytica]
MTLLFTAFIVAFLLTMGVVRLSRTHAHLVNDHGSGPQKFHARPVPRVGGVGIVCAVTVGALALWWQDGRVGVTALLLLACAVPAFGAGIVEDITKRVSPGKRLLFTAVSAVLAGWLLDALIRRTDIPGLDWVVSFWAGAVLLTVVAVAGIANAVNLIDGFNGLSSMCVLMMLASLAYVGFAVDDQLVAVMALVGVGAVLGFFVWNYPAGLVFLGDGGAYFLGFYLAELSILLLARNPEVSPMFPLTLVIYPVFETLFSMYRRKWLQGRPVGMPDGVHLHSLIYRRLLRWAAGERTARELTRRNSMTAPYLWLLCMLSVVPAVLWWDSTPMLAGCIVLFAVSYVTLYWRIVRFRAPRWMVLRRSRRRASATAGIIARHDGSHANRGTGCRPQRPQ